MAWLANVLSGSIFEMKRHLLLLAFLGSTWFHIPVSSATPPGKQVDIEPLQKRVLDVTLFLHSIGQHGGALSGVEFVWFPETMREVCMHKHPNICRDLDHERRIERYTDSDGRVRVGLRPWSGEIPTAVITSWVVHEPTRGRDSKETLNQLSKIPFIKVWMKHLIEKNLNSDLVRTYDPNESVRATVEWTQWHSGDRFEVIRIHP